MKNTYECIYLLLHYLWFHYRKFTFAFLSMYSAQTTHFTRMEVQGLLQVPKGCQPLPYTTQSSCSLPITLFPQLLTKSDVSRGMQKPSKDLEPSQNSKAPEGWEESSSTLRIHKYVMPPYTSQSPQWPGTSDLCTPDLLTVCCLFLDHRGSRWRRNGQFQVMHTCVNYPPYYGG